MKTRIKCISLVIGLVINISAKTEELTTQTACVKFVFDEKLFSKRDVELDVTIHSFYYIEAKEFFDQREKINVKDSVVKLEFEVEKDISIFSVKLYLDKELHLFQPSESAYLVEKGDSLIWHISDRITLSGKGNEKNKIRQNIRMLSKRGVTSWFSYYINKQMMDRYFSLQNEYHDALTYNKLNYLDKLRRTYVVSDEAYAYIKEECIFDTEISRLHSLYGAMSPGRLNRKDISRYAVAELKTIKERGSEYEGGTTYKYIQYLMDLIDAEIKIPQYGEDLSLFGLTNDFRDWYERIVQIPNENVRNQMLTFLFARFQTGSVNADLIIDDAIGLVSDVKMKSYLKNIKEKRYSNTPIYPFNFEDLKGNIFTPDYFKGKKVIFDFWFYGCSGCIVLHTHMAQFEKDLDDPDVVFVSVNVDKKRDKWLLGLETGQYTTAEGPNLRITDSEQEMLAYYEYFSFPQLLIMDENGNVLAYNTPKPVTKKNKDEFKAILYQ